MKEIKTDNDAILTDIKKITDNFVEHYRSIGQKLAREIEPIDNYEETKRSLSISFFCEMNKGYKLL